MERTGVLGSAYPRASKSNWTGGCESKISKSSSISAFPGIKGGTPAGPYAILGGIHTMARSPTVMVAITVSHPAIMFASDTTTFCEFDLLKGGWLGR